MLGRRLLEVIVHTKHRSISVEADILDVARLVASARGFHLDIEPMEPGRAKLTATHGRTGAAIHANGTSVVTAAEKLIDLLTE